MKRELFGGFPGGRFIDREELKTVTEVIKARSPYRFYGLELKRKSETLERLCCRLFKRKYALAVSSGTAALHAALFSLGVSKNDEVIVPAYAWISDIMAILAVGAVPVIAPIDQTLGLDPSSIEGCITKKTKAIIAVHMRGSPCDLENILKVGHINRIKVVEDGAQCIGGRIGKSPVGALGDASILSFQYNKLVTCGEGGALLTDDKDIFERACRFHDLGMLRHSGEPDPQGQSVIRSFGLNYRMNELQAAFLIPQLNKMPNILRGLEESYNIAIDSLASIFQRFELTERKMPSGTKPNYAFLYMYAKRPNDCERAYDALRRLKIPVQRSLQLDGHNFRVWREYMVREGRRFRLVNAERSLEFLKRSLYIEINSKS